MKKILISIFFTICVSYLSNAQTKNKLANDSIIWRSDYLLSKDDFKAKPDRSQIDGLTSSGIMFYTKEINGELVFYVEAIFIKSKSFIRKESAYVLNHEQKHFDLTELYARKLRQKISSTNFMKVKDMIKKLTKLYNEVLEDVQKEQNKYDKETEHGMNMIKQTFWNEKISNELQELVSFESIEVNVNH